MADVHQLIITEGIEEARRQAVTKQERMVVEAAYQVSWLRVSGTAKLPQIDQGVRHQFHPVVALLFELEA